MQIRPTVAFADLIIINLCFNYAMFCVYTKSGIELYFDRACVTVQEGSGRIMGSSSEKKKYYLSLDLLKGLTILLIINSHADVLYPAKISFLASGGGIGNELFFLISGYLFGPKEQIGADLRRRWLRLYLPAYIMIAITALIKGTGVSNAADFIRVFIWPTMFWFVGAIFVYTLILYIALPHDIHKRVPFCVFGVLVCVIDLVLYLVCIPDKNTWIVENAYLGIIPYRSIYSIFSFFCGYYIKKNKDRIHAKVPTRILAVLAVVFFAAFYLFKFCLNKQIVPMPLQILSHPLTVISAVCIFLAFETMDLDLDSENDQLPRMIKGFAKLSLEAYLVQFLVIAGFDTLKIMFPFNMILCVLAIVVCAKILQILDGALIKFFERICAKS